MENQEKNKKGGSALAAAAVGRSAVGAVDPHSNSGLANTGTNISYEGATAPGSGGSAGTGYASGKEATDETITTSSEYEQAAGKKKANAKEGDADLEEDEDLDDEDLDMDDEDIDDEDLDEDEEADEL